MTLLQKKIVVANASSQILKLAVLQKRRNRSCSEIVRSWSGIRVIVVLTSTTIADDIPASNVRHYHLRHISLHMWFRIQSICIITQGLPLSAMRDIA
jgi:hypothetical protein